MRILEQLPLEQLVCLALSSSVTQLLLAEQPDITESKCLQVYYPARLPGSLSCIVCMACKPFALLSNSL